MAYGMPSYLRDGTAEVSFAKQAHYLSLYILNKSVLDANRSRLVGLDVGKGCVRYRHPGQLDWDVVAEGLLVATASSKSPVCTTGTPGPGSAVHHVESRRPRPATIPMARVVGGR